MTTTDLTAAVARLRTAATLAGRVWPDDVAAVLSALESAQKDAARARECDLTLSRVLHELAGEASMCWQPRPSEAIFDTGAALLAVERAINELRAILRGDAAIYAAMGGAMRELSDSECMEIAGSAFLTTTLIRAGYAAGYAAAQVAMPPMEPTMAMLAAAQEYLEVLGETVPHDTRIGLWREMYYAWQEQTGGKAANVPRTQPDHAVTAGPLDHQSAAGTNCATEEGARPSPESARGPAAEPIADLCMQIRAFLADAPKEMPHEGYRYGELLSFAADALERLARERDDIRTMLQDTNLDAERFANIADKWKWQVRDTCIRAERAEAERDALRECVRAADYMRTREEHSGSSPGCVSCAAIAREGETMTAPTLREQVIAELTDYYGD